MSILDTVYASAPDDVVLIPTIELNAPSFAEPIRNCTGFEDQTVGLDGGGEATFLASGLDVALPAKDESGQQNLIFAIENVTGEAQQAIDAALENGDVVELIYRLYLSTDLTQPAEPPRRMVVIDASFSQSAVQVTASYNDIINRAWPRRRYTADFAPGLKYIA